MNRKKRNQEKMKTRAMREVKFELRVQNFLETTRRQMLVEDAKAAIEKAAAEQVS